MSGETMPRDVAILPIHVELPTGEVVILPGEIWQLLEQATVAGANDQDDPATAFVVAFAKGLVEAGLLLVKPSDPKSTQSVSVQTYSLALQAKHAAEAKLGAATQLVLGWEAEACRYTLMHEMAQGVLSLCGHAPPSERNRLHGGFMRLRALAAILKGSPTAGWDLTTAEPPPAEVTELIEQERA